MVELEIDGQKVEIVEGSMVMHAAQKLGLYVPHFCYHKKLSIAANCRMCLVEVEKAPKAMPACATPVSAGMKVFTKSDKAVKAQQSVMEFLLINHPLDCPICDQGGECQLQDLAVGYGASKSKFSEEKRVVFHKNMGPLISSEEMSRCIHCTRCVRFGQEIAGQMELGMAGRGEHSEIMSFLGGTVDSELSGNMIDVCPVGALTSKPFRYSARTWELTRRKSIAPHDSLGSNIIVQSKGNQVLRVVPFENDEINECWISDRDRFSYEGLNSTERLTAPQIKEDGEWKTVDWQTALEKAVSLLKDVQQSHGAAQIGTLIAPTATLEEMALAAQVTRALGSQNVDFRLRQSDDSLDTTITGAPWLGMPVQEFAKQDRFLMVGSFLRKDAPLLASQIRQAVKRGAKLVQLHAVSDDLLMPVAQHVLAAPSQWENHLAQIWAAVLDETEQARPSNLTNLTVSDAARSVAKTIKSGQRRVVVLGNAVMQHPRASALLLLANGIANAIEGRVSVLGEAANSVGGYFAKAIPGQGGMSARSMLAAPRKAYITVGCEPQLDCADAQAADLAMDSADAIIALSVFDSPQLRADASVILPITPFTETAGSFINAEGRLQSFTGVVRPLGDARPAWKVLRVIGNMLDVGGFDAQSAEQVRDAVLGGNGLSSGLSNVAKGAWDPASQSASGTVPAAGAAANTFERVSEVPSYFVDALVRRAGSLQQTREAREPVAYLSEQGLKSLGVSSGDKINLRSSLAAAATAIKITAIAQAGLPDSVVRVAAAHANTIALGGMFGHLVAEKG